jgi:type IV pilus assembly protein PilB
MATIDRTQLVEPSDEVTLSKALANRYRCEFVDLREVRIDHDLFHSVPVDLMFRYNFVPIQSQNGTWTSRWPIRAI